jgi:DNA-binding MarR family transcriptional regulator
VDRRLGEEFQTAFWAARRALDTAGEAALQRYGVRSGQQWVLRCLWSQDGLTPGEVARRLGLSTPTVTKAATRMAAAGLLSRRPHPSDARLVRLYLTGRGRELEATVDAEMQRLAERALAGIEPADRETLVGCLATIRRNLS